MSESERVTVEVGSRRAFALESRQGSLAARRLYQRRSHRLLPLGFAASSFRICKDRPLTLQRYPNGIDGSSFFEKQLPEGVPDWVARVTTTAAEGAQETLRTWCATTSRRWSSLRISRRSCCTRGLRASSRSTNRTSSFFDLDPGEAVHAQNARDRDARNPRRAKRDRVAAAGENVGRVWACTSSLPLAAGYTYETAKLFAEVAGAARCGAGWAICVTLERTVGKRKPTAVYLGLRSSRPRKDDRRAVLGARPGRGSRVDAAGLDGGRGFRAQARVQRRHGTSSANLRFGPRASGSRAEGDLWAGTAWKKQRLEGAIARAQSTWA